MSEHKPHVVGIPAYLGIITALMILTGITVWAAFQDFGAMNNVVAMAIAAVKTLLVVAIFMHLRYSAKIVWMFAGSGIVFFIIMMTFLLGDYKGRALQQGAQPWEKHVEVTHTSSHEAPAHP